MAYNCDLATLIANSNQYLTPRMGEGERDAIELYARIQGLQAAGGTDYRSDLNALLTAARKWMILEQNQRCAISLHIDIQNAINNGASITEEVNALKEASKCYACLGRETKKNLLKFLKCAINTLGKPD